jgi:hypothetical protein
MIDYKIVSSGIRPTWTKKRETLSNNVRLLSARGWIPLGGPFLTGETMNQAMTKENMEEEE